MNDFLGFRKLITPIFIQVIFWLGIVGIVILFLSGLGTIGLQVFLPGLLAVIAMSFFWRIYCEIMIVFFRMHEELVAIRQALGGPTTSSGFPVMPAAPVAPPPGGYVPPAGH